MRCTLPHALTAALALSACAPQRSPSFLVVSMDTFRADRLGSLDARGLSRTPRLDALAARSSVYRRAYAQANETLLSHGSLFMGKVPSHVAPLRYDAFTFASDAPTLAARLARAGYRTEAVVSGGHLNPDFGLWVGFQRYATTCDFCGFQQSVDEAVLRLETLAAQERPFLLFVHGYDNHAPYVRPSLLGRLETPGYDGPWLQLGLENLSYERVYDGLYFPDFQPPEDVPAPGGKVSSPDTYGALRRYAQAHPERGQPLTDEDLAFLRGSYDAAASLVDFHVGRLLDSAEELGLGDELVVVVLSDHGEGLLDHGFFNHRATLHDENARVVLVVHRPGQPAERVDEPVALLDVAPTLLALAGLEQRGLEGRDLGLGADPDRVVLSESVLGHRSARNAEHTLILRDTTYLGIEPPAALPEQAWLGDASGRSAAWDRDAVGPLWAGVRELWL